MHEKKICAAFTLLSILTFCLGVSIGRMFPYHEAEPEIVSVPIIEYRYISTPEPELATLSLEPEPFYSLSESEREVVECIVEGDSGNQSLKGRKLVAQCIYNACVQDDLAPSEVRDIYGYLGWSENVSEETKEAVIAVFDNGELETEENILWFYNPKGGRSKFHESQKWVITEEDHKFFAPWEDKE